MEHQVERLVVRSREGDAAAFDALVALFQRRVFYTILRVVRDTHRADDLTQEVFIAAYKNMQEVKEPRAFLPWLLRVAMNRAIDARRKSKREQERIFLTDDFSLASDGQGDPAGSGATEARETEDRRREVEARLKQAIDALPEGQREVLLLSMGEQSDQEQIAQILGIPRGTVKSRLFHARRVLAARLRDVLEEA
jgi:RNA polymerase sigma-70 factor (ECF subfamily)